MSNSQSSFRPSGTIRDPGELRREQRQFELEMRERRMMQMMQEVRNLARQRDTKSSLHHPDANL